MKEVVLEVYDKLIYDIVGAAHEVHNELHYGLSEAIYEESLCIELNEKWLEASHQIDLPVFYKDHQLEKHYRMDLLVENMVLIELKAVDTILPEHRAQLFNYLRITHMPIGLLINFGKSVYVEKYFYNESTNEIAFLHTRKAKSEYVDDWRQWTLLLVDNLRQFKTIFEG